MLRFLADENFSGPAISGLLRRKPELDLVRVQDVGLSRAYDPDILAWAAIEDRILLTHDLRTMPFHSNQRVAAGLGMPGVFAANSRLPIGQVIDDILLLDGASDHLDWEGRILYLPV